MIGRHGQDSLFGEDGKCANVCRIQRWACKHDIDAAVEDGEDLFTPTHLDEFNFDTGHSISQFVQNLASARACDCGKESDPNLLLCSAAMPANDTDCLIMHGQQIDGHGKKL